MSENIVQLTAVDFDEAIDFLNLVFGGGRPQDFEQLLPDIYRSTERHMRCNYAIRCSGKIRSIVGMFPKEWQVGSRVLRVAGIGGVSTHPKWRGRGFMSQLMNRCGADMKEQGYHLSWLGGQRQRYGYFGYERCGVKVECTVRAANVRHGFKRPPPIRFKPISVDDGSWLEQAKMLHDGQRMHCRRSQADFHKACLNWHNRPHIAIDEGDQAIGYLISAKDRKQVTELVAMSTEAATDMIAAWAPETGRSHTVFDLWPNNVDLLQSAGKFAEECRTTNSGNWRILDWPAVIDALLTVRCNVGPMAQGKVKVEINGFGCLEIAVDEEGVRCASTEATPQIACDAPTAMRLLFGPMSPGCVLTLPPEVAPLLDSWCPLPLYWPRQDGV